LFTSIAISSPKELGVEGDLVEPFLSSKVLLHPISLVGWSDFNLHKNEGVFNPLEYNSNTLARTKQRPQRFH
jgi:hypothetical protein